VSERVLFVDDDANILLAIERTLRKKVDLRTAPGGAEGLQILSEQGPFALVVSDMRMPGMGGVEFLTKVRQQSPDTVRVMLSGQSDLQATIAAVNEGHIYRFLSKPCAQEQLLAAVADGLQQHRLLTMEKVLLQQTLSGSVKMLIEILGMVSPAASTRASRLQRYVINLAKALCLAERWEWGLAAYVSQIGCVALPADILSKVEAAQALSEDETKLYESHPEVAHKLLAAIPRLEDVAAIVTAQFGALNLVGKPQSISAWDVQSVGQMLLRTALEFDRLICRGVRRDAAVEALRASKIALPQMLLKALSVLAVASQSRAVRPVRLKDLALGMVLAEDLVSAKGIRLVPAGQEVTRSLIIRLNSIAAGVGVAEPFRVSVAT
jgi:response regulator RpfG family c-di-GMP phosphodiesterase